MVCIEGERKWKGSPASLINPLPNWRCYTGQVEGNRKKGKVGKEGKASVKCGVVVVDCQTPWEESQSPEHFFLLHCAEGDRTQWAGRRCGIEFVPSVLIGRK